VSFYVKLSGRRTIFLLTKYLVAKLKKNIAGKLWKDTDNIASIDNYFRLCEHLGTTWSDSCLQRRQQTECVQPVHSERRCWRLAIQTPLICGAVRVKQSHRCHRYALLLARSVSLFLHVSGFWIYDMF